MRKMIYDIIQQEFTDKAHTVIASSHRLGTLKKGWKSGRDVLVRMVDGRVMEIGDLSDVLGRVIVGEDASKILVLVARRQLIGTKESVRATG